MHSRAGRGSEGLAISGYGPRPPRPAQLCSRARIHFSRRSYINTDNRKWPQAILVLDFRKWMLKISFPIVQSGYLRQVLARPRCTATGAICGCLQKAVGRPLAEGNESKGQGRIFLAVSKQCVPGYLELPLTCPLWFPFLIRFSHS
jgi:hypothetical protein